MKLLLSILSAVVVAALCPLASADQASETTVAITGQETGPTPFISRLKLTASQLSVLKRIQFAVIPKPGSVTRPLSATYTKDYLAGRGYVDAASGEITLPVFGLYDGYANKVVLTYFFADGSSKKTTITVATAPFDDACDYNTPVVLQARTSSTALSYDFFLVGSNCGPHSPTVIDTDGAVRWVGTANVSNKSSEFFNGAIYQAEGPRLLRIELDGVVTVAGDYGSRGVHGTHHNIDPGKFGLLMGVNTDSYTQSVIQEVAGSGEVLKVWNLTEIIRVAMIAGGDDPSGFISQHSQSWFHNNSATYRRADDSLIVSSRENFVICIDYKTGTIKWILGDTRKEWYLYPSLKKHALELTPGGIAPNGQHTVSIGKDGTLLLMDNGVGSLSHFPRGPTRHYAAARKYKLDLQARTATEVWNFTNDQSAHSPFCSSVYEDAPENYLVDYAPGFPGRARILGLSASGEKIFEYAYPTRKCEDGYRSLPIHWENLTFPATDVRLGNLSARAEVKTGDDVTITGFIISGSVPKTVALRGLGPSLQANGKPVPGRLMNPRLELHDSDNEILQINDNYKEGPGAAAIIQAGLAPNDDREAAIVAKLAPGAYTALLGGTDNTTGIGLAEVFDLTSNSSQLDNLSARAFTSPGDAALIGGLILDGMNMKRILFRALGPELAAKGVANAVQDPTLEIYDAAGAKIASNDNWRDAYNASEIEGTTIAPTNDSESAILVPLGAGNYTFIARGKNEAQGVASVEAFRLD